MPTNKSRTVAERYAELRVQKASLLYRMGVLAKYLKRSRTKSIKFRGYTLSVETSSRRSIPREAVIFELGPDWVRNHEVVSWFKTIRIVKTK